jgi:hypothetical protein
MRTHLNVVVMTMGGRTSVIDKLLLLEHISQEAELKINIKVSLNSKSQAGTEKFISNFPTDKIRVIETPQYFDSAEEHLNYVYKTYSKSSINTWLWVISDEDPFLASNLKDFLTQLPDIKASMIFLGTRWQNHGGWFSQQSNVTTKSVSIPVREKILHVGIPYAGSKIGSYLIYIDSRFESALAFFDQLLSISILFSHGYFYLYLSNIFKGKTLVWDFAVTGNAPNITDIDRAEQWLSWHAKHNRPFHLDWTVGQILLLKELHDEGCISSNEIMYSTISDIQRGNLSFIWDLCWRLNNKVIPCLLKEEDRFPDELLSNAFKFLLGLGFINGKLLDAWQICLSENKVSNRLRLKSAKFALFSWDQISQDEFYFLREDNYLGKKIIHIQNSYVAYDQKIKTGDIIKFYFHLTLDDSVLISDSMSKLHLKIEQNFVLQDISSEFRSVFQNVKFMPCLKFPFAQVFLLQHAPRSLIRILKEIVEFLTKGRKNY